MVYITPCKICEGLRPLCIHKSYPLPKSFDIQKRVEEKLSKDFFGPSYSVFVGRFGLPNVHIGPMIAMDFTKNIDNPGSWFGMDYGKIIELRSFLLRSKQKENIHSKSRFIDSIQELALAKKPTDVETRFKKKPIYKMTLSETFQPMGPSGDIEKMRVTENVKISRRVDSIVSDDLKAVESISLLYENNQDIYKIINILSSGILGKEDKRKMVPSRWSTTASHSIVANRLIKKIKDYSEIEDYRVYHSSYLDNHYTILLIPGSWEFENFEVWAPGSNWYFHTQVKIIGEYEPYKGRTKYASLQAGGFYSSRLGICEFLNNLRKQAKVVVFREVGEGYSIPMGVWVCLETVRNATRNQPRKFNTEKEALEYVNSLTRVKIEDYVKNSKVLERMTLKDFI